VLTPNWFLGLPLGIPVVEWFFGIVFREVRGFWLVGLAESYAINDAQNEIVLAHLIGVPVRRSIFPNERRISMSCIYAEWDVELWVSGKTPTHCLWSHWNGYIVVPSLRWMWHKSVLTWGFFFSLVLLRLVFRVTQTHSTVRYER
jgi:hypothetical protein